MTNSIEELDDVILGIFVECEVDEEGILNEKGQKAFDELCRRAEIKAKELEGETKAKTK